LGAYGSISASNQSRDVMKH